MDKLLEDPQAKENFIFLVLGIMLGWMFSSAKSFLFGGASKKQSGTSAASEGEEEGSDWSDEDESDEDASNANAEQSPEKDKALFAQFPIDDVKQVFAVRTDLGMTKGKIGAQVGHATLGAYNTTKKWAKKSAYWRKSLQTWSYIGQKKICVKATSEAQLLEIKAKA